MEASFWGRLGEHDKKILWELEMIGKYRLEYYKFSNISSLLIIFYAKQQQSAQQLFSLCIQLLQQRKTITPAKWF